MKDINLELDILKEMFNVSVGRASSLLSEIIDRRIILNVPDVKLLDIKTDEFNLEECLPEKSDGIFMISSICFEHELQGKASLIFSAKKIRKFIDLCIKNDETEECYELDFSDIDFDVVKEMGNIVLNSVVGEVGNLLNLKLNYTLPQVQIYNGADFYEEVDSHYSHILILNITFLIEGTRIEGAILVHLTLNSFNDIIEKIKKIKDELYE